MRRAANALSRATEAEAIPIAPSGASGVGVGVGVGVGATIRVLSTKATVCPKVATVPFELPSRFITNLTNAVAKPVFD